MNKVINININGLIFHIDEEAFGILERYLESLKRHFKNTEGGEEILADIESRIAEMLTERLKNRGEVVSLDDVQQVIATMGTPEDMDDTETETKGSSRRNRYDTYYFTGKRMYRDPDNKKIAGVCSGISEYFDIDPLWLRLLFVAGFFGYGLGPIVYIVLWIVLPVARTPSERLEMRGERINISNIEKTVKENLESIKDRIDQEFKNFDRKDFNNKAHHFFEGLFEGISSAFGSFFYVFARIFSVLIAIVSVIVLITIICSILGAVGLIGVTVPPISYRLFESGQQASLIIILLALVIGLPFLGMLLRAVRYLAGFKRRSRFLSSILGTLWFLAFIALLIVGFNSASNFRHSYSYNSMDVLRKPAHDTLYLTVNENGPGKKTFFEYNDEDFNFFWRHFRNKGEKNDFGFVTLDINRSEDKNISLEKDYYARGRTVAEANSFAGAIQYSFLQNDSLVTFDKGFSLAQGAKWRVQHVNLILKIPEGTVVYLKRGMEDIIYDIDNTTNTYDSDMVGHKWLMTANGLICLDCPKDDSDTHTHHHKRNNHTWRWSSNDQ